MIYPFANVMNNGADRFFVLYQKTNQLILFKLRYGLTTLFVVIVAIAFKWNFLDYVRTFILVEFVFGLFVYYFIYRITDVIPFGVDFTLCKRILTFAIPMGVAALISTINSELDKLVIGGLTNTATLAIYTNAARELPIVVFSSSISTVVMPFVVQKIQSENEKEAALIWKNSIKLSSFIMCFFVTAFFVFAPQVISVLYSDKYTDGTNIFRVYLFALLFRFTYYGMALNAMNKTKLILTSSMITMIMNLVLDYILYFLIGISGPAWATVISVAIMNMTQLLFTCYNLKLKFNDIYPCLHIVKIIAINIFLGMGFYFLQQFIFSITSLNKNVMTVFIGIIWTILYFLIVHKRIIYLWKILNS